ncbi:FtsX-like permease family protein [bacterium]|nr:FtsX-like permease family protein [bacterium]
MKSLNSALVAIRRTPYQSILSIAVLTITFFVAYAFSLMTLGSQKILSFFETQPKVIAFFKLEAEDLAVNTLADELRRKAYVKEVIVVDKKQALEIYRQENQDNPLLLELVTEDILPASIEVSAHNAQDLNDISQLLKSDKNIEEVNFQEDVMTNLIRWTNALRLFGLFLLIVLLVISFLMIMVTISMKISSKRSSIKIMKFIGANNSFISRPYLLEGIILALIASLIAFAFYYALLLYISPWLTDFLTGIVTFPLSWRFFAYQVGAGLMSAIILGTFASAAAVNRMLRR